MSRPTVEDVSDSDPEDVDITSLPSALTQANAPSQPQPQPSADFAKRYQCLYPLYFDATRARSSGRRVSAARAVRNPLAMEIASACHALGLHTVLEMDKTHPNDWANPGRVRVDLRSYHPTANAFGPGAGAETGDLSKHQLLNLVAGHLQSHPTTEQCRALRYRIPGAPPPPADSEAWPRPAVPRGWKMGELLPFVSPALTGGGVSEDLLGDMMKQMGGGGGPMDALMGMGAGPATGAGPKKKIKAKK